MSIQQSNMLITFLLLIYCMLMFTLAWIFNRPLDLENFLILVTPIVSQVIHNVASTPQMKGTTT